MDQVLQIERITRKVGCAAQKDKKVVCLCLSVRRYMFITVIRSR